MAHQFDTENVDYLIHITTGTPGAQIGLFLLTEARGIPGRLLQTSLPQWGERGGSGMALLTSIFRNRIALRPVLPKYKIKACLI